MTKKKIICLGLTISAIIVNCVTPVFAQYPTNDNVEIYSSTLQEEEEGNGTTDQYKVVIKSLTDGSVSESSVIAEMNESSAEVEMTEPEIGTGDTVESSASTFGIVGEDERVRVTNTKSVPYRYIAYLRCKWPNGDTTIGSAFMIGKYTAATAGHCVFDSSRGGYPDDIAVWPGMNTSSIIPYSGSHVNKIYLPKLYKTKKNNNYDAAVIKINSPLGQKTGYMGLRKQSGSYNGINMYVSGYPADHYQQQWKMKSRIIKTGNYRLIYKIDTMEGQSGSPIFRLYDDKWYAIGIHTTGYYSNGECVQNGGVKFHSAIYAMMKKYK